MLTDQIYKLATIFLALAKQHPSAGMLFFCPDDGTVLLTKRSTAMKNPLAWDIQGGRHSDGDHSTLDTAKREAQEEIFALPKTSKIVGKHILHHKDHNYLIYICEVDSRQKDEWGSQIKLDYESTSYQWFPYDQLPADTHIDLTWVPDFIDQHY